MNLSPKANAEALRRLHGWPRWRCWLHVIKTWRLILAEAAAWSAVNVWFGGPEGKRRRD